MPEQYKQTIKKIVLHEDGFIRLTLKGQMRENVMPWRRVIVRPVLIKQARQLQFSYFDAKQDITRNYQGKECEQKLDELLALPFTAITLQSRDEDLQVQVTKEGKATLSRHKPAAKREVDLSHDTRKELALPVDRPDAFLQTIGIMNKQGQVIPSMQDKFSQINEFLKLLEHTGELAQFGQKPIHILDCGSGSAYLSFALYHYLHTVKGLAANLVGVDTNGKLVEKSNLHSQELGFEQVCFQQSAILDYQPAEPPDIVLGLHACDTATDDALLQGIQGKAQLIVCAPCCHHELHQQLHAVTPFQPVFQHGILKKRLADILTDTFRAQILRIMGYKTDVVEFVSSEHTDRNVMIRAVKRGNQEQKKLFQEYEELKAFWDVTPYLERVLRERECWPLSL